MYRLSSDPGTSKANGIFGLMFGFLFLAMGVYVFATIDPDIGVFLIAMALLGIMFNGYRAFNSGDTSENDLTPDEETEYTPEVRLLILDRLRAEGFLDEEEYKSKRQDVLEGKKINKDGAR